MKTVLKWIGIAAVVALVLGIVVYSSFYIYDPGICWPKPGIPQGKIPAGVDTSIVFENVTVIPMDSERIIEGQTVIIEDHRITDIGTSAEIEIPANAHIVDGDGRFLIPGLSDMIVHTNGSEKDVNPKQAYCVKCRAKREMKNPKSITMKNGKPATQGVCPDCGTKMFKIGKS